MRPICDLEPCDSTLSGALENVNSNVIQNRDRPVHGWYRFVLSFPPHLVRRYLDSLEIKKGTVVLDPFCGTGTTLVEAKMRGLASVGVDAHPFAALVSGVKTRWDLDRTLLKTLAHEIIDEAEVLTTASGLESLSLESRIREDPPDNAPELELTKEQKRLIPTGFVSERPLQRILILLQVLEARARNHDLPYKDFFLVAVAHTIANGAGNFAFGPEIYRTKPKTDYDVLGHFTRQVFAMLSDLESISHSFLRETESSVMRDDARTLQSIPEGIGAVITSPPYPNEKDYTRTTRVESLLLGLFSTKAELRQMKEFLLRSNTRNVFVKDQDAEEVRCFPSIIQICEEIEKRREDLRKTSGFEKLYHKVVAHYFGGMRRHFRALRPKLRDGARLAYVVGDQLSFLMVPIPTAKLLGEVARSEGFGIERCDLWRERIGTKIKNDLANRKTVRIREEVLILKKL